MTPVRFACPACSRPLECDLELVGSRVTCPECGADVTVPVEKETAPVSPNAPEAETASKVQAKPPHVEDNAEPARDKADADAARPEVQEDDEEREDQDADDDAAIEDYCEDGQPPKAIHRAFDRIEEFLKDDEDVEYIAVQHNPINPLDNMDPGFVVATPRRLMICRPKLFGRMEFRSFHWYDVAHLRLTDKIGGTTISFRTTGGEMISVDLIPKAQARHLYVVAQQCEEMAREERRKRIALEQSRARAQAQLRMAGPATPVTAKGDPVSRLRRLKEMLDQGLITQEDYAAKKREFLSDL